MFANPRRDRRQEQVAVGARTRIVLRVGVALAFVVAVSGCTNSPPSRTSHRRSYGPRIRRAFGSKTVSVGIGPRFGSSAVMGLRNGAWITSAATRATGRRLERTQPSVSRATVRPPSISREARLASRERHSSRRPRSMSTPQCQAAERVRMVNRRRRLVAAVSVVGLALGLAACNRNYEILGPYSLGFDGQHLLIGICTNMTIDRVSLLETGGPRTPGDTREVWEANGDLHVRTGDALAVGGSHPGLVNEIVADEVHPRPGLLFELGLNDADDATLSASFEIPDEGLASGAWLTPLGEIHETPCEASEGTE